MLPKGTSTLLLQRILPSYRVAIYRALYEQLGIVTAHSSVDPLGQVRSASEKVDYPNLVLEAQRIGPFFYQPVLPLLKNIRTVITEFSPRSLNTYLLPLLKRVYGFKLVFWTHGITNSGYYAPGQQGKQFIKDRVLGAADALILYDDHRADLLRKQLDVPIFVARNTLYTPELDAIEGKPLPEDEATLRNEMGYDPAHRHVLYLGRLTREKRLDLFLEVAERLRGTDTRFHIVGGGEMQPEVEEAARRNPNILHHGEIHDTVVKDRHLRFSDVFLNPGYIGLAIVEAFCYGLPVLTPRGTAEGPLHSPEIYYLHDGENGLLTDGSADAMAQALGELLNDRHRLDTMRRGARATYETGMQFENMLGGIRQCLDHLDSVS